MDSYAVFGHPIAHSKSPLIHAAFARQTGEAMCYSAVLVPLDGFVLSVEEFARAGGCGANVTLPFKQEAFAWASRRTPRAELAGAVNTLIFKDGECIGDNTDGAGLLRDITQHLATPVAGKRVLLLGAGGATRGALAPLLEAGVFSLTIANRAVSKAEALSAQFAHLARAGKLAGFSYADLAGHSFDVVIDATSASLSGARPDLPDGLFAPGSLAYSMMYGEDESPFLRFARAQGAGRVADGLGMLVEQAAESFYVWRGVRPECAAVRALLQALLKPEMLSRVSPTGGG